MKLFKLALLVSLLTSTYGMELTSDTKSVENNQIITATKTRIENPFADQKLQPYMNTYFGWQLFVRPVFPEDYSTFLPIYTNPNSMKYFGRGEICSSEVVKGFINRQAGSNLESSPTRLHWTIVTHDGIAGKIDLCEYKDESTVAMMELIYCICPQFERRGITTEASRLLIDAQEGPFVATVHPQNIGSREVLKKLGFRADLKRMGVPKFGSIRDYYVLVKKS